MSTIYENKNYAPLLEDLLQDIERLPFLSYSNPIEEMLAKKRVMSKIAELGNDLLYQRNTLLGVYFNFTATSPTQIVFRDIIPTTGYPKGNEIAAINIDNLSQVNNAQLQDLLFMMSSLVSLHCTLEKLKELRRKANSSLVVRLDVANGEQT